MSETPKPRSRKRSIARESALAYGAPDVAIARLAGLIDLLGNNRVAELIGVNKSQPSRWRSGKERMSAENRTRVLDLDYVFARLTGLFGPKVMESWLTGSNPWLGTGRPIDVMTKRGPLALVEAIDAEEQMAYF